MDFVQLLSDWSNQNQCYHTLCHWYMSVSRSNPGVLAILHIYILYIHFSGCILIHSTNLKLLLFLWDLFSCISSRNLTSSSIFLYVLSKIKTIPLCSNSPLKTLFTIILLKCRCYSYDLSYVSESGRCKRIFLVLHCWILAVILLISLKQNLNFEFHIFRLYHSIPFTFLKSTTW